MGPLVPLRTTVRRAERLFRTDMLRFGLLRMRDDSTSEEKPRLVLRFAIFTALALGLAAAGILFFVHRDATSRAEQAVVFHAQFVADSILAHNLEPSDFVAPIGEARSRELDELFQSQVADEDTVRVTLYDAHGRIVYSSGPTLTTAPAQTKLRSVAEALAGVDVRTVGVVEDNTDGSSSTKVLEAYVPVAFGPSQVRAPVGVFELDQDYGGIAEAARGAFLAIAIVLSLALVFLYLLLFPILRGATARLRRQALYDALTEMPNRSLFRDRAGHALLAAKRQRETVAIMLLDLDRFKEVNDTLGHQSGDLFLQQVGQRLRGLVRESDTVARLGGDEFGVVAPGLRDPAGAVMLAERIRDGLTESLTVSGITLEVDASIGIALYPTHGNDVDALIRHADVAMYVSKETHAPSLYTEKDDHYSPDRLALVGELRGAIENEELLVYYQPQATVGTREVKRVEALVRWEHPERGLLGPDAFIPLAEQTGLIRPLTRYVLSQALRQCRAWQKEGLDLAVAVNVSGRDLLDLRLPDQVAGLLELWGIDPGRLELEITENTILTDPVRTLAVLRRLSELGVRLAIDDFGSGHSSLGYLKRLPVDVLKIDKSFVLRMAEDDNDAVIVRTTIDLGHNLGLEVVAEGVEDEAIWQRLVELGCDTAQGYCLSRPVSAETLAAWSERRKHQTAA